MSLVKPKIRLTEFDLNKVQAPILSTERRIRFGEFRRNAERGFIYPLAFRQKFLCKFVMFSTDLLIDLDRRGLFLPDGLTTQTISTRSAREHIDRTNDMLIAGCGKTVAIVTCRNRPSVAICPPTYLWVQGEAEGEGHYIVDSLHRLVGLESSEDEALEVA